MKIETKTENGRVIAVVSGKEKQVTDVSSALDLMMAVKYKANTNRIAIEKTIIGEDFFILSTGLAGEILQKFVNYQIQAAIYGDYSRYRSKPLKDFIYESNNGKEVFFVATKEEAVRRLAEAP